MSADNAERFLHTGKSAKEFTLRICFIHQIQYTRFKTPNTGMD
jgi:hypothetical protein